MKNNNPCMYMFLYFFLKIYENVIIWISQWKSHFFDVPMKSHGFLLGFNFKLIKNELIKKIHSTKKIEKSNTH